MAEAIVDGRGSGNLAGVTEDNKLMVDASVSNGSVAIIEVPPTDAPNLNLTTELVYSGTVIGSLIAHNPAGGSYVKVLSYDGSDNLINVGSWV